MERFKIYVYVSCYFIEFIFFNYFRLLTFFIIENVYKKRVYDKESRLLIVMVSVDFSNFKDWYF